MKRTISKSERPYRLLLCVMISLLVIMLAGCSTSSDSDTNTRGFTDFATIEEEYLIGRRALRRLMLWKAKIRERLFR